MTREEAIEVVKKNWPDSRYTSLREALEFLIPEFRESKDERIRKALIYGMNVLKEQKKETFAAVSINDCLAWLEKQKIFSEKGEGVYGYKNGKIYFLGQWLDNLMYMCDAPVGQDNDGNLVYADGNLVYKEDLKNEKQKEQKPAVTHGETYHVDTLGTQQVITGKMPQKLAEIAPNQFDGITYGMQGYSTEKPAEWSKDWREEDIQTRFAFYTYKDDPSKLYLSNVFVEEASRNHGFGTKILIAAEKVAETIGATTISLKVKQDSPANAWYRKNGYGYVAFEDGYDWLEKNLEYMKPNKQEWSEEDKVRLSEVIEMIKANGAWIRSNDAVKLVSDWLESLPERFVFHPKPEWSEEKEKAY